MKRLPFSADEIGAPPNKLARLDEPKRGMQCYCAVLSTFSVCAPIFCTNPCLHLCAWERSIQTERSVFGNRLLLSPWCSLSGTLLQGAPLPKTTPVSSTNHTLASCSLVYFIMGSMYRFLFFLLFFPSFALSAEQWWDVKYTLSKHIAMFPTTYDPHWKGQWVFMLLPHGLQVNLCVWTGFAPKSALLCVIPCSNTLYCALHCILCSAHANIPPTPEPCPLFLQTLRSWCGSCGMGSIPNWKEQYVRCKVTRAKDTQSRSNALSRPHKGLATAKQMMLTFYCW